MTFIEVLKPREGESVEVEPGGITSGDYLRAFMLGTREALSAKGRESITLTLPDVSEKSVGAIIALFDRATGYYASFVGINAYHQPGVEAGKKAAGRILEIKRAVSKLLAENPNLSPEELAEKSGYPDDAELIFFITR